MFGEILAGIILIAFAIACWLYRKQPPKFIQRWAEEEKREREERCAREEEARKERDAQYQRALENLRKISYVCIRRPDGGRSSFEAALVGSLLKEGCKIIKFLSENESKKIAGGDFASLEEGDCVFVGTAWSSERREKRGGYWIEETRYNPGHWVDPYMAHEVAWNCDYRVARKTGDGCSVIAAGNQSVRSDGDCPGVLANDIVRRLLSTMV